MAYNIVILKLECTMEEIVLTPEQTAKLESLRARWDGVEIVYRDRDGMLIVAAFYSGVAAGAWREASARRDWETANKYVGMVIGILPDGSSHS
jgi:hypothetical protein